MAKSAESLLKQIEAKLAQTLRELPPIIANEAENFTLDNFQEQAWRGFSQEQWKKRKNPTKWGNRDETDRALLVKTGQLKRSIRSRTEKDKAIIMAGGADTPYARVHNEGFRGAVVQNVEEHIRKTHNGKRVKVKAFTRTIHQNIPRRQFIGGEKDSPYLKARIRRTVIAHLRNNFKLK